MKNYRVGYVTGGVVREIRKGAKRLGEAAGPWKEKQKPKPGPKPGPGKREKLKKGRDFMEDPYGRKGREGREAPKAGPRAPSRPKKTWPPKHKDLLQRYPKMPQPHKSPGDIPYIPMPKHDPNKPKKWKPAAEGGRTGLKKGGPKPGTHDYFLLHRKREKKKEGGRTGHVERVGGGPEGKPHSTKAGRIAAGVRKIKRGTKSWNKKDITNKRISKDLVQDVFNVVARKHSLGQQGKPHSSKEGRTASFGRTVRDVKKILSPERDKNKKGGRAGKAFGGPSHSVRRTVKKILKKAKAKKDTESVKDVR